MGKPESSDPSPEGTGWKSWFFIMSAENKLKCAPNNSALILNSLNKRNI